MNAILPEEDVPSHQLHMVALNAEIARVAGWPAITKRKAPSPDADEWRDLIGELGHLIC